MEGVSLREIWMLLGEKDVQIYQLMKERERLLAENVKLMEMNNGRLERSDPDNSVHDTPDKPEGS